MDVLRITATELKCACADSAWLQSWLAGKKPPTRFAHLPTSKNPTDGAGVSGAIFHKIAEDFISWLTTNDSATRIDTTDLLWEQLYRDWADKQLDHLLMRGAAPQALELARALRSFCCQIARMRSGARLFQSWCDLYVGHEYSVQDVAFHFDTKTVFVSGRIDSLRRLPTHELEIADYKLHRSEDRERDLIQVAIYAALLSRNNPALRFSAALEYYLPALEVVRLSAAELATLFEKRVLPVLEQIARGAPTTPSQPATTRVATSPLNESQAALAREIEQTLGAFKLPVEVFDAIEAPQLIRFYLRLQPGVKFVSVYNRAEDLQVQLGLDSPPLVNPASGAATVDILKTNPDTIYWRDVIADLSRTSDTHAASSFRSPVTFLIGIGVNGQPLFADFADPNSAHALVAGTTGSGKSEFLKAMLATLMARNTPQSLRLTLVDPKQLTFVPLASSPFLAHPVITNAESAIPALQKACDEMESRNQQLLDEGFNNLNSRFEAGRDDLPFHLFVFDEFADLLLSSRETRKEFETLLARLSQMGRAAGLHLVLATQRPDRTIVSGLIKSNLPLKICLRVNSQSNSMIMLDESGGETLAGRGDLLCNIGRGIQRAQAPFVTNEELLRAARIRT